MSDTAEFFGHHEFHVTANPNTTDPDYFKYVCGHTGVKAHVIYNELPGGGEVVDLLTGSTLRGTTSQAYRKLGFVAGSLQASGIDVVREKIETVPEHPLAPTSLDVETTEGGYFEAHFTIPDFDGLHERRLLRYRGEAFYLSTTDSKRANGLLFATMRDYHTTAEEFVARINAIYEAIAPQLINEPFDFKKPVVEFALFDSNPNHDIDWVNAYRDAAAS
jgi:hypothetical protein